MPTSLLLLLHCLSVALNVFTLGHYYPTFDPFRVKSTCCFVCGVLSSVDSSHQLLTILYCYLQ